MSMAPVYSYDCSAPSAHTCSIGFRSGDKAGQGNVGTFCVVKKVLVSLAASGRALSCCKTVPGWATINGKAI